MVFQVLKLLFITKYKIELINQFLYFLLFYITWGFTSADIIFDNFLEPNPSFSEKRFSPNNFLPKLPNPFTAKICLPRVTKVICWGSLNLKNLIFYILIVVGWLFNFTTQINYLTEPLIFTYDHEYEKKTLNAKTTLRNIHSKMSTKICEKEV